jgi:hypothetical protein
VRRTFASRGHSGRKASNSNRQTALSCSEGANSAQTCPPGTRFKSYHALGLFFVCVTSILLAMASHTGTMAPLTATEQIATLPIQVPPKEHFCLNDIIPTCIVYRGQAWYAKLRIEGETADQLLARLVKGEEDRGCTLICKKSRQLECSEGSCKRGPTSIGERS